MSELTHSSDELVQREVKCTLKFAMIIIMNYPNSHLYSGYSLFYFFPLKSSTLQSRLSPWVWVFYMHPDATLCILLNASFNHCISLLFDLGSVKFFLAILPNFQVLVGTGSRTMTIIRIKSLKVYAFGFCKSLAKIWLPRKILCLLQKMFPKYLAHLLFQQMFIHLTFVRNWAQSMLAFQSVNWTRAKIFIRIF